MVLLVLEETCKVKKDKLEILKCSLKTAVKENNCNLEKQD